VFAPRRSPRVPVHAVRLSVPMVTPSSARPRAERKYRSRHGFTSAPLRHSLGGVAATGPPGRRRRHHDRDVPAAAAARSGRVVNVGGPAVTAKGFALPHRATAEHRSKAVGPR